MYELAAETLSDVMYVWECTSVGEDPAGSCSNCRLRTYTKPVITNTRHDIYSESIYHSSTWALGQHDPKEFL